jgi:hypothetical protein
LFEVSPQIMLDLGVRTLSIPNGAIYGDDSDPDFSRDSRCRPPSSSPHGGATSAPPIEKNPPADAGLQRLSTSDITPSTIPATVDTVLASSGQPLDAATRAFFEPRFGCDFGTIRVHTDRQAAESAESVHASAYTVGEAIVFGAGQYAPATPSGRRLLAHELTHVVQQSERGPSAQRQDAGTNQAVPLNLTQLMTQSSLKDRCQPYGSAAEARAVRSVLLREWLPAEKMYFGDEVAGLWSEYLNRRHGAALNRRIFRDPSSRVVQEFVASATTRRRQHELVDSVNRSLSSNCPTIPAGEMVDIRIEKLLSKSDLEDPINFTETGSIPGHIAGGVSDSDAGPDRRVVSGFVRLRRSVDGEGKTTRVHMTTHLSFQVLDALDFCPGGAGTGGEQRVTIPLGRLETTGMFLPDEPFAYDLPFEVSYSTEPVEVDLDAAVVKRCYPDAEVQSEPAVNPPTQPRQPDEREPAERR